LPSGNDRAKRKKAIEPFENIQRSMTGGFGPKGGGGKRKTLPFKSSRSVRKASQEWRRTLISGATRQKKGRRERKT